MPARCKRMATHIEGYISVLMKVNPGRPPEEASVEGL